MKKNVHPIDRVARILLGIALLVFFAVGSGELRILGLLGIVPLLTGSVGFCPIYSLLGIEGCGCKKSC